MRNHNQRISKHNLLPTPQNLLSLPLNSEVGMVSEQSHACSSARQPQKDCTANLQQQGQDGDGSAPAL